MYCKATYRQGLFPISIGKTVKLPYEYNLYEAEFLISCSFKVLRTSLQAGLEKLSLVETAVLEKRHLAYDIPASIAFDALITQQ